MAPLPLKSKLMSMYLPKRDELSFRLVLALPNASKMSLDCSKTFLARSISAWPETLVTAAMYLKNLRYKNLRYKNVTYKNLRFVEFEA